MRHLKSANRRFGKSTAHRKAMMRNMVTSLIQSERIVTTVEKAKELRKLADRMITLGKKNTLASRRQALSVIFTKEAVDKLFSELAVRYKDRLGGYTRIVKLGWRQGDNADMAAIEYIGNTFIDDRKKVMEEKRMKADAEAQESAKEN